MRTLSILERKSIGGGLSSASIKSQTGGYGAMPNGEGGGTGGGSVASNVAGSFVLTSPGNWQNTGGNSLTTLMCSAGTTFSFNLGLSTTGKIVNAQTGLTATLPNDCRIITKDTSTGIQTNCPANGGLCQVINTKTGEQSTSNLVSYVDQTGFSDISIGEGSEFAMGGSDLAGGSCIFAGSFGNYGGFGFGGDN